MRFKIIRKAGNYVLYYYDNILENTHEFWIGSSQIGVMLHCFGVSKSMTTKQEAYKMANINLHRYIDIYRESYED